MTKLWVYINTRVHYASLTRGESAWACLHDLVEVEVHRLSCRGRFELGFLFVTFRMWGV